MWCAVKQSLMLSASRPPFMDPVMDTASEGFKDSQAAHLLKKKKKSSVPKSILQQTLTKPVSSVASK